MNPNLTRIKKSSHKDCPEFDPNPNFLNPYLEIWVRFGFRSSGRVNIVGSNPELRGRIKIDEEMDIFKKARDLFGREM